MICPIQPKIQTASTKVRSIWWTIRYVSDVDGVWLVWSIPFDWFRSKISPKDFFVFDIRSKWLPVIIAPPSSPLSPPSLIEFDKFERNFFRTFFPPSQIIWLCWDWSLVMFDTGVIDSGENCSCFSIWRWCSPSLIKAFWKFFLFQFFSIDPNSNSIISPTHSDHWVWMRVFDFRLLITEKKEFRLSL